MARAWKLSLIIVALMLGGAAASFVAPSASAAAGTGVWAEVCCGTGCSPGDYCTGSGTYTCCKGGELELQ
jgi:hypothetical protein